MSGDKVKQARRLVDVSEAIKKLAPFFLHPQADRRQASDAALATHNMAVEVERMLRALPVVEQPAVKVDHEEIARQIYASMIFANQLEKASEKQAAWVEGGNSLAQREARACVARILAALEPAQERQP